MWDNNVDSKEGVSIWGHVRDGMTTGALGGALLGGIGTIPGAVAGGLVGLGNGLWNQHREDVDRQDFMSKPGDEQTVDAGSDIALGLYKEGMSMDDASKEAANQIFLSRRAADQEENTSLFDLLF